MPQRPKQLFSCWNAIGKKKKKKQTVLLIAITSLGNSMLTLLLHFKSDGRVRRAFDGLSCKISGSVITHIIHYMSWLKMNLLCPRYQTVAGMLLFFSSRWQGKDLFGEALITEYFGKLVQRRLGGLPRALVRALRSGCALGALWAKISRLFPPEVTLQSVKAAHVCYSKSEPSTRCLFDLTDPQQFPATNRRPALRTLDRDDILLRIFFFAPKWNRESLKASMGSPRRGLLYRCGHGKHYHPSSPN